MPIPHLRERSYGYISRKPGSPHSPRRRLSRFSGIKKSFGMLVLSTGVIGFLFLTLLVAWTSKDLPDPDRLTDRQVAQSTKIYDRTGEHLLYEIFAHEKRTLVNLEDLPPYLVKAVIATEDTKFYEHKGVRPLSMLRALIYGLLPGKRIEATSTLTQQLVKNAILTNERRLSRKIKEIILSIRLEQKYTKDQILKIYFNEIPYGSTNYGIESASQSYFGKHVSDLTLAEAATLAGLPKAPSRYLNNHDALKQRRDFVLKRMAEEGYITDAEKTAAQHEPLNVKQQLNNIIAPHFVLYVKEQLVQKYGETLVDTGGLKVVTTLDWDKQEAAEKAIAEVGSTTLKTAGANNVALTALDPKTGQIVAMVGSRDFFDKDIDGQFNVATLGKRQPGSSFKPIVYAAAFEKGYTPDTILFDAVTNFAVSGKPYMPHNYDLKEHGPVTMRQALQGSLNIPAVETLYLVGPEKGVDFAERMGYTTLSEGSFGLSLVLGGGEVKLLEHTSGFGVFANNGVRHDPVSILKVDDADGTTLEEWKQTDGTEALDPKIAATVSNVLSDDASRAYIFGAGGYLTLPDRPVAVKTGTTNNYVDAWTMGYVPSLVAGIWVGNTNNTPMNQKADGSKVAAPIWNAFMRAALKNTAPESFPTPPPNDADKPILRGSTGGGITILIDEVTGKRATSSTPSQFIKERTYIPAHSILHYVRKDDPRGPAPDNPAADPQYSIWESAIQDWAQREKEKNPNWNLSFEDPPTEFDDEHSWELIPTISVFSPAPSSTITSRDITTDIQVSAERGVAKVTYAIDGHYVAVVRGAPFNLNYHADTLEPGPHLLSIIVEDDIGDRITKDVPFLLDVPPPPPTVTWDKDSFTVSEKEFPKTFVLNYNKLDQIKSVTIFAQKEWMSEKLTIKTISDFSHLFNNQITFTWGASPGVGSWNMTTELTLTNGEKREGGGTTVVVE